MMICSGVAEERRAEGRKASWGGGGGGKCKHWTIELVMTDGDRDGLL